MKYTETILNKEQLDLFKDEAKLKLIWKLGDLSKQIQSIIDTKKSGKIQMETINLGTQNIDNLLILQQIKSSFLYNLIGMKEKDITELYNDMKSFLCPDVKNSSLCCEKHFLTWSKLILLEEYGFK